MGLNDCMLHELYEIIMDRKQNPRPESYTAKLLYSEKGINSVLEKVGEEAIELIIAAKDGKREDIIYETADLFYHVLVMLAAFDIRLEEVWDELERRKK